MKVPTCLRIVMIAMDLFFLIIGVALFVGGVVIFNEFPASKQLLAPSIAENQSIIAILGVAGVGIAMSVGSVFGGYGTMKNRDIWLIFSSSLLTPCFATLFSLGVCIIYYQNVVLDMVKTTLQHEASSNISSGLLKFGNTNFGCCGLSDLTDGCDRVYPPLAVCRSGSQLCQKGCTNAVWNNLFVPYINGAISALFTISAVLLAGIIIAFLVYKSIVDERANENRQLAVTTSNRAIKQE